METDRYPYLVCLLSEDQNAIVDFSFIYFIFWANFHVVGIR